MRTLFKTLSIALIGFCAVTAQAAIQTKEITYKSGDTLLKGYVAWDDSIKGKMPGVLVVHEWWGQNGYARHRAEQLAALGYTGFALDMYGDGKSTTHPKEASEMMQSVMQNKSLMQQRFDAALAALKEQSLVDPAQLAAIGYCMGGGIVLEMAREGADLALVASFHGSLGTDHRARKGDVKAKVLVFSGTADSFVKPEQVEALKQEMADAGVDFHFISYPDAKHGFTNPEADALGKANNLPLAYDAKADADSWSQLVTALGDAFKK